MLCQCNYVCIYKYLKEKTKRAQAKPAYGEKKKKKEKEAHERCKLSNNCKNIVRMCCVSVIVYAHINI